MEKTHQKTAEPDWAVVAWLRSDEGERWLGLYVRRGVRRHNYAAGVFADILPDPSAGATPPGSARWPEPHKWDVLQ